LGAASPAFGEEEESLVPPGNSAVNQYTESYPTTRGNKTIHAPKGSGGQQKERSPKEVLGSRNSKRLEQHGSDGQAVAELATETAPATTASGGGGGGGGSTDGTPAGTGSGAAQENGQAKAGGGASHDSARPDPGGSSAFSEVVGEATGSSSSDGLGVVLPLLILAAVLWALLYAWRHRRHQVS
ncbi:MAG TPA: hypothetical protein VGB06_03710, partial [Solirubrobacterales bacterium]